jgi:hypothetical protein
MAGRGSTVVDHLTHNLNIQGLNPAGARGEPLALGQGWSWPRWQGRAKPISISCVRNLLKEPDALFLAVCDPSMNEL